MKPRLLSKRQAARLQFRNGKLLESSRSVYSESVRSFFRFIKCNGLSDEFDIVNIDNWLKQFNNTHTYNIRLTGIKEFYYKQFEGKAAIHRLKMREDFERIRRRQPSTAKLPSVDYLTRDQVNKLCKRTSERISCIIAALFWTGCRISELINIRIKDCRESDPVLIMIMGKGQRQRHVYLPIDLYKSIRSVFNGKEYLFETRKGLIMSRVYMSMEIRRQSRRYTGLSVHAHMLRHSKAMYLKEKGLSPDQIARALGHANVTTTLAFYLHGTPGAKDQGIPIMNKENKGA